jgi:hypothetical protein
MGIELGLRGRYLFKYRVPQVDGRHHRVARSGIRPPGNAGSAASTRTAHST